MIHPFSKLDENSLTTCHAVAELNMPVSCIKGQMQSNLTVLNKKCTKSLRHSSSVTVYCESCPQLQHSNINSELILNEKASKQRIPAASVLALGFLTSKMGPCTQEGACVYVI